VDCGCDQKEVSWTIRKAFLILQDMKRRNNGTLKFSSVLRDYY
jgi:hypothetical protein